MKNILLLTLTLASIPLTLEAMSKAKQKEAPQTPATSSLQGKERKIAQPGSVEEKAFNALKGLNFTHLIKHIDTPGFDSNCIIQAQGTLLEFALAMPLHELNHLQLGAYELCLNNILKVPGLDVNARNGLSPVFIALSNPSYRPLMMLLHHNHTLHLDLNERNPEGLTPLLFAIANGNNGHLQLLLDEPAVDATLTHDDITALQAYAVIALTNAEYRLGARWLLALVERGAPVNRASRNKTALEAVCELYRVAAGRRHNIRLEDLVGLEGDKPWPEIILGLCAVGATGTYAVASSQTIEVIDAILPKSRPGLKKCITRLMLGYRIDLEDLGLKKSALDEKDDYLGMTLLMWAAARGNLTLVQELALAGSDPLKTDKYGNTPLHQAVRNGHTGVARYLKELDTRVYLVKNCFGRTPVDVAISSKQSHEMLHALAQ